VLHLSEEGWFAEGTKAWPGSNYSARTRRFALKPGNHRRNIPSSVSRVHRQGKKKAVAEPDDAAPTKTPHEILESGYQSLRAQLAEELLDRVIAAKPVFFERLVVELLVRMGYGGSLVDAGRAIGRSGDGGIDGIIKEDRLGLEFIFIQAKRWSGRTVGRPDVQQFAGALAGHGAGKGVFITTSDFSREAIDYAASLRHSKIVLIDGEELAGLMIDHGIGCATTVSYEVKRIDSDYFSEAE
jgi:restriction system protein